MDSLLQLHRKDVFPYAPLREYDISIERGFLPASDPLLSLPPYFRAWDETGANLPKLLIGGSDFLREVLSNLPLLDTSKLITTPQRERAMILLSYLAHAYVWCDADGGGVSPASTHSLPACIAVPWYKVSKSLGRIPCLHFATIVQNWRLLDDSKPIELGNVVMNQTFYGGIDEEWFFLIPIAMEAKGGGIMNSIVLAQQAVDNDNKEDVACHVNALSEYIIDLTTLLHRMREWCHPTVFYVRVRPFLHGWSNLPNGLVYEGVSELAGEPQKFAGGSAAQTPLIQVIDAGLGIKQTQPFLKEMRKYMQPLHVKFLTEVEENSTIRQYVAKNAGFERLVVAYNQCIEQVAEFRSYHIQLAASYIISQAPKGDDASRGTGGSNFIDFLKKVRDSTLVYRVEPSTAPSTTYP